MSGSLGELNVKFTGDASGLAATISEVQSQLSGFETGTKGAMTATNGLMTSVNNGTNSLTVYKSRMDTAGKTVEQYKEKLNQSKAAIADNSKILEEAKQSYERTKKSVFDNCAALKKQESSLGVTIRAKQNEISALEKSNTVVNKNSRAYNDNINAIKWTKDELGQLEQKQLDVRTSLNQQGRILNNSIQVQNKANAAVSDSKTKYLETNEALRQSEAVYAQYQQGLSDVEKAQRIINTQQTAKKFREVGGAIDTVTKPLQYTSVALAAGGVASAKFAIDFEDNFANVKKTVDGTPQQLQEVRQGIIDLSTTGIDGRNAIPQTTAQLTELAAAGGQLGIKTENIVGFTETMAQMGTATNLAGEQGAKTLARFMNVAGVSQDQVGNLGSSIVDLGNNFATTEAEIADMAMYMGATGSTVGISAQDVLAYSTALSSLGAEAASGGSAVSRIWMQMHQSVSEGGEDLETFAELSGKSSEEFKEQWNTDASGAFQDFLKGLSKADDQVSTLSNLGFSNIRDLQALLKLAGSSGIDLLTKALKHSNTAWAEGTALQKEFDAKAETTASQIQLVKNNLIEAARGIGETFLPTIKNVSGGIKDFAQDIANMSDDDKQRIISIGTSVVALGAGAKLLGSGAKGVGNFIDNVSKIRSLLPAAQAASQGIESLSLASSGFTAVAPALVTALGWLAVPATMYVGMELWASQLEKAEQQFLHIGDGAVEISKTAQASVTAAKDVENYAKKLSEVNDIIAKGSDGTTEGDTAYNQALEQRKEYIQWFIDNYGEYVSALQSGNEVSEQTIGTIRRMTGIERDAKMLELNSKIDEGGYNLNNLKERISSYNQENEAIYKNNSALIDLQGGLKSLNAEYNTLDKALQNNAIGSKEYGNKVDELKEKYANVARTYKELTGEDFKWGSTDMVTNALAAVDQRLKENNKTIEANKSNMETAKTSIKEYQDAARTASDIILSELPNAIEQGGGKAQEYIAKIGEYGNKVGFTFNEMSGYANQAALKLNGFNTAQEAVAAGSDAMNATVNDVMNTMQSWGYSASQAAVQGALLKNGFNDIASAAGTDGGLETVTEQANELAHNLGLLPENKSIKISAEGDVSVIDETNKQVDELNGSSAVVNVKVDGKDEVMSLTDMIQNFGLSTAIAILRAQDDASITIDDVKYKIDSFSEQDHTIILKAEDGSVVVLDTITGKLRNLDGTEYKPKVTPEVNSSEVDNYKPEVKPGTVNYGIGTSPKTVPPASGTANYGLGKHPTAAPSIPGTANYTGKFPSSAPTLHGTVVYEAIYSASSHGGLPTPSYAARAKGDKNFPGGMAMINDEKGTSDPRELVEYGGRGYIFEGRDVVLPLPEHAKIYTAKQTRQIMSGAGIPRYASGKNNEDWENAKSDREHIRKTSYNIIPAWEELEWLDQMKQKFADDAEVIKEIEEEIVNYTREMWSQNLESMEFALDMGWTSQEEYYNNLAVYRDENFAPDTQEWKDATLKLHKYSQQLINDANAASKAYIDLHASINDWDEMGTSMGAVWQTVNQRNVQAAKDGLITWEDYFDTRLDYTEQFLDGYLDYSDDWIDNEKEYNNMSAADTIAAVNRQRKEVEEYFAGLGELTDEEKVAKIKIEAELDRKSYDAVRDKLGEWEDDADWTEKQAGVYGWEEIGENKIDFYQRKIDKYTQWSQDESLDPTKQQYARRQADEMKMKLYEATEDRYDEMLDMAKERMDEVKDLLDDKLSALEESWEVEDRAEDKAETLSDIEKYKNAVTIEGKQKYQEALDKLKEIERDEQRYQIEQENNAIIKQMEAEYKALEDEKTNILQQTKEANLKVASVVEPLEQSINTNMDNMADKITTAIKEIKPSVTINQENTNNFYDTTDNILYSKKYLTDMATAAGG